MTKNPKGKTNTDGHEASLIQTDSPDDFDYEGKSKSAKASSSVDSNSLNSSAKAGNKHHGDNAYVTVDNPDDFE